MTQVIPPFLVTHTEVETMVSSGITVSSSIYHILTFDWVMGAT